MSQKKLYLFNPDGKEEGWYMEDEAPPGWLRSKPELEEGSAPNPDPNYQGSIKPETPSDDQQLIDDQQSIQDTHSTVPEAKG